MDNSLETKFSIQIDMNICANDGRYTVMWVNTTEALIQLARKLEVDVQNQGALIDEKKFQGALSHFWTMLGTGTARCFNWNGVFYPPCRPLRLPAQIISAGHSQTHPLINLPKEILTIIFNTLDDSPDGGRAALALTCRGLAIASQLATRVECPTSMAIDLAMQQVAVVGGKRRCCGCFMRRSVDAAFWHFQEADICSIWYTYPSMAAPGLRIGGVARWRFNEDVRRWCAGEPHTHGTPYRPDGMTPLTLLSSGARDVMWCFSRYAFTHQGEVAGEKMPLCPPCAAQHAWEIGHQQAAFSSGPINNLERSYTGSLQALWWRRRQFLDLFPGQEALFPSLGQVEVLPKLYTATINPAAEVPRDGTRIFVVAPSGIVWTEAGDGVEDAGGSGHDVVVRYPGY